MWGVGNVIIHTANDEDQNTKAVILKDIRYADKIKDEISKKIHQIN